jgi:hypothetical protein
VAVLAAGRLWSEGADPEATAPLDRLVVDGPTSLDAGQPWSLAVERADGVGVGVEVWGPWGVRRIDVTVDDGTVTVPGFLTTTRGRLTALLTTDDAVGRATVTVVPGPAVDGIVPLAGPRSIVADGADWTMVTAIPTDRFGNAVADGTPVQIHRRRPDGSIGIVETAVDGLLAAERLTAGTAAGRSTIRVGVDTATGAEVEVLEVPGPPVVVELSVPEQPLRADGRRLVVIASAPLADRFGNQLLDGTAASVAIDGPLGVGTMTTVTIDGRAEFVLESPAQPGTVELRAIVDGVAAEPLTLEFVADIAALPVSVHSDSGEGATVSLTVGPVTTSLGGFAPDGTSVHVQVGDDRVSAELRDGMATIEVDAVAGDLLVVEILGATTEVVVP